MNSLNCILNILGLTDLSLIWFNTSCEIYSISKEPKYKEIYIYQ